MNVGVHSDGTVLHVLKHGELVDNVDDELVDEGIVVFVLEQWHSIAGDSIETKINRFSKELLAYIEMCVAFSPYYRQDDPRNSDTMDTYFRDALQTYADVTYKDLHDYLVRRFHAWYTKFKPSSSAVVSAGDPESGAVMQVESVDGAAPPAKKPRYSLTLNDVSAAPCAAPAAASPAAPATADDSEGGEDAAHKERSGQSSPL
jgi:hypothetical protein